MSDSKSTLSSSGSLSTSSKGSKTGSSVRPRKEKRVSNAQPPVTASSTPVPKDTSLPPDVSFYKKDSLQAATDLIQDKEEFLQQEIVPHLENAELKLEETKYYLNYSLRTILSDPWEKIDLNKLKEENKTHEESETKHWSTITNTEQKVDGELKNLRRLYLQGAVNLHLYRPTPEQISHDQNILGDFKKSTQRLASCKQYLISGSSMKGGDNGNSHFRSVTTIQEDSITYGPVKAETSIKKKESDGLLGTGPHGTKVYSAEWLKYPVAVKKFSKPIEKERLNILKNMENFKHLVALRGIVVPKDEKHTGTILVLQFCSNYDLKSVLASGTFHFSFPRKLKWIQSISRALEWLHQRDPQIIHSRLTPNNILLSSEWKLLVGDYGLGFETPSTEDQFFFAPELLASKKETPEADVYSFGAIVWYLITEKKGKYDLPFPKVTEALQKRDASIFPLGMPKALETLIFDCVKQDPSQRPNFFAMNENINWETMGAASLTKNNEEASKIWTKAMNNGKVQFPDLAASYMATSLVKNKLTPEETLADPSWRCLAKFFENEDKLNAFIDEQDWMKFVHFFNPIDETTLLRVHDLFSQKWYYGRLSKAKAGSIIDATLVNSKVKKIFLVRESSFTKEGNAAAGDSYTRYTVTYYDTRTMKAAEHSRLPKIQTSLELIAFVNEHYSSKAGWAPPSSALRDLEICFVKGETSLYMSTQNENEQKKKPDWDKENVRYIR